MDRVPEKELMEDPGQVRSYAEADFSSSDSDFISRLGSFLANSNRGSISKEKVVLDLGCGPGNITERIAIAYPNWRVIGVDGSEEMLNIALQRQAKRQSLLSRVEYLNIYLSPDRISSSTLCSCADIVVSNSALHHFSSSISFWETVTAASSSGTIVFMRDLRRPTSTKVCLSLMKKYVSNCSMQLRKDYFASLQSSFTVEEVRHQLASLNLNKLHVIELEDQYLEVFGEL